MRKPTEWFRAQPKGKKIQFILASVLTLCCVVSYPAMAWFSHQRELKAASYINAPVNLYITATHETDSPKIDLGDIDVERKTGGEYTLYKNYVFCVRNINVEEYILQLACTTNTPFTYEIYAAEYKGCAEGSAEADGDGVLSCAVELNGASTSLTEDPVQVVYEDSTKNRVYGYKRYGENLLGDPLNPDAVNAAIANKDYHDKSYGTYDTVQQNVEPMYYQTSSISGNNGGNVYIDALTLERSDYYILRVSWTEEQLESHAVGNNKETDIIYITAGTRTQTAGAGN